MQSSRPFEDELARRLRAELDGLHVGAPARNRPAPTVGYYWVARPLAVALIAALALGVLAAAVTKSPDPTRWVQPAVWERALGAGPPTSEAVPPPAPSPSEVVEPEQSPGPVMQANPSPESEPAERPSASEPHDAEPPSAGSREGGG